MATNPSLVLENGLSLGQVLTTGSVLQINEDYENADSNMELETPKAKLIDFIGEPVMSFEELKNNLYDVDPAGLVKKKILEEGGGFPLDKTNTVYIAFSGYWEKEQEPFDIRKPDRPLIVDLSDSGLLPGLQIAIESMLVGELAVFLLPYELMYGELGIAPRIKPKADCIFYVKLIKSIITPTEEKLNLAEPNIFQRVYHEVKLLYGSGVTLYKTKSYSAAIQIFRKAIYMLHNCRLADEDEEILQEKMLKKLYINLAVCYNITKQPLKACVACNELNRLGSLWNNAKVLLQNAKALRMIGQFEPALKKLRKAKSLCPHKKEIDAEFELLQRMQKSCDKSKLLIERIVGPSTALVSEDFKNEVDNLIKNFKENVDLCKLVLPGNLNLAETEYIKEACVRENVFFNKIHKDFALDKDDVKSSQSKSDDSPDYDIYGEEVFN